MGTQAVDAGHALPAGNPGHASRINRPPAGLNSDDKPGPTTVNKTKNEAISPNSVILDGFFASSR